MHARLTEADYGSEVPPKGPRQDMFAGDVLAGGPAQDRTASAANFTGGDSEMGLGGTALGQEPGLAVTDAGVTVQRGEMAGI